MALLASPAMPATVRGDLAPHRTGRIAPRTGACPPTRRWGGYPGGLAVTKGDPLFPRRKD